jgi:hypothetical protein
MYGVKAGGPRWRHARRSRRRTILPACSKTRPSFLLGRPTQLLSFNRRILPILSDPRTPSTRWTIIVMGSISPTFGSMAEVKRNAKFDHAPGSRRGRCPPRTNPISDL